MSNDTVIFFDNDKQDDGMVFLWWGGWDDDFLGGLWLSKKDKTSTKRVVSSEMDDTAIASKNHTTEEVETPVQETVSSSLDALVIKKAEPQASKSFEKKNHWSARWAKTDTNKKFSITDANKLTFEKGKTTKKRVEWENAESENALRAQEREKQSFRQVPELKWRPWKPVSKPFEHAAGGSHGSWEDRRRLATGQAVVFANKIGGQRVHQQSGPKKEKNLDTQYKVSQTITKKEEIVMWDSVTVKEFAEKMGVPIAEVIKKFIANKMLLSLNSSIDFDTAALIAMEFEIKVLKESATAGIQDLMEGNLQAILEVDKASPTKEERPPIVTIMGHVDHGKTTLLDYIRNTGIAGKEHGGITQSIWWSQIIHNGKKVTFIDTPWHALFTSLRARGSKITDIVIIVIAADDGVMKQTVEAINHAKAAKVPIIVAVTKIDKWVDNSEFIKTQLSEHGLIAEDRWGDVPIVKVSGKTGEGIDDLMDQILLHAEVSELVCDPERNGIGVVLEAYKDIQKWVITTMILITGTIKVGEVLWIHNTFGKIKKIYNRKGQEVKSATGGDPIMVLGINDVPEAGKLAEAVKDEKAAKLKIDTVLEQQTTTNVTTILNRIAEGEVTQINLLVKADSRGSLEALKAAISQIELPESITFKIVHSDIGNFFDSDLDLAKASDAVLIGFGTWVSNILKVKVDNMGLSLKMFNIIYELTDYLEALAKGMIKVDPVEVVIGKLKVLGVFYRKGNDVIFGGKIIEWEARNGAYFRLMRWEELIDTGKITSLQKGTENVDKMGTGHECGMKARIGKKIEVDDIIDMYVME